MGEMVVNPGAIDALNEHLASQEVIGTRQSSSSTDKQFSFSKNVTDYMFVLLKYYWGSGDVVIGHVLVPSSAWVSTENMTTNGYANNTQVVIKTRTVNGMTYNSAQPTLQCEVLGLIKVV